MGIKPYPHWTSESNTCPLTRMLLSSIHPAGCQIFIGQVHPPVWCAPACMVCTRLYGVAVVVNGDVGPIGLEKRVVVESGAQLGAGPGS